MAVAVVATVVLLLRGIVAVGYCYGSCLELSTSWVDTSPVKIQKPLFERFVSFVRFVIKDCFRDYSVTKKTVATDCSHGDFRG